MSERPRTHHRLQEVPIAVATATEGSGPSRQLPPPSSGRRPGPATSARYTRPMCRHRHPSRPSPGACPAETRSTPKSPKETIYQFGAQIRTEMGKTVLERLEGTQLLLREDIDLENTFKSKEEWITYALDKCIPLTVIKYKGQAKTTPWFNSHLAS
ncbi:hypothetical protein NDU88_001893 [Pleurodeles waltl]|uniref:Uncharacterized protein n=1 Tax=Pleurodeles waltl TaxID=8319 RepID=A0AAV7VYZ8_PLEWA|nr:hypothetical protein NDU88_001893 [Pleurodeles waltl]